MRCYCIDIDRYNICKICSVSGCLCNYFKFSNTCFNCYYGYKRICTSCLCAIHYYQIIFSEYDYRMYKSFQCHECINSNTYIDLLPYDIKRLIYDMIKNDYNNC